MQETAVPSAPPTPPVSLAALLSRDDLGLRQITGPPAGEVTIHGAHTSEMSDPYPYLLGGELLLTAGVHIPEAAGRPGSFDFDGYVARIVAAGGAALGFGVAPVHDTVPAGLVAACEQHGLPLVEVPPRTTFSGVARAVWQLMARARLSELRRITEAQQGLAAAASRPDPVPSVLRRLAGRLEGRAVLYGPEGAEIAAAGREPGDEVRRAMAELARFVTGHPSSTATDTVAGTRLAAYALGPGRGFVLGVAAPHRESGDHTIASVAAVLLSLLTGEHQSGTGAARSSALVRLLLGARREEVAPLLGGGEGDGAVTRWYVVHARPDTGAPDAVSASALGAALGSPLVDAADDVVRVLVPAPPQAEGGGGVRPEGDGGVRPEAGVAAPRKPPAGSGPAGSVAAGSGPAAQPGWTLGVSAPVVPAEWPAADAQAARALARARATRSALVRHAERPGFADLVPPGEAEAHARALLAPIGGVPALAETLRAWLSLHGSWDRTAVALSVHRNTVRQRIARCAALLGADLDDPDVRMELWFALRHLRG
ncbi:PucR family transcriptional regulator [Streptomyces sp. CS207]|uniref:PucR family transcriptional regulator n=1 Tax=Streptomyces sp. CS207 TaxID=2162712 RepID=UPI001EF6C775|nr:PucR family transcriptional regulator [Streptomyces sp. CS207]